MELDVATFKIKASPGDRNILLTNPLTRYFLEKLFYLPEIKKWHSVVSKTHSAKEFVDTAIAALNVQLAVNPEELNHIPRTGPVLVVANNPSSIDGFSLASLMFQARPDVKCIGDTRFNFFPQLKELVIAVDTSKKWNPLAIRSAIRSLNQGKLVTVTPAGNLSYFRFNEFKISDPTWNPTIAKLIHATKVPVVPLYRSLKNSWTYQIARRIHPALGSLLQPAEFIKKRNAQMNVRIGKLIPYEELAEMDPLQMTNHLRSKTYSLGEL